MADISKIQMPSGNVYDIKDAVARSLISGGVSFNIAWNGSSTPVVANIPEGVVVTYNDTDYTGTLTAANATSGSFYLVKSNTQKGGSLDVYDEYTVITSGNNKYWEKIGDTQLDLSDLGTLAYKDSVALNKQTDIVLGESTTFTAADSAVSFTGGTTDKVLGEATTFALSSSTVTVTPTTTNIKATASGTAVGADGTAAAITGFGTHSTETFVKSVSAETSNKLVTTTVPNVTSAGTASTWSFAMGSGDDSETLIISGANGTAPTLGDAKTVATGSVSSSGTGSAVVTGVTIGDSATAITALGTPTTSNCLTGVKVTTQPTIALATGATAGTGVISVATGITSASVGTGITVGTNDKVTAVTGIGTGTAAAQTITVGTNDKVTVLKNDTSVTVS